MGGARGTSFIARSFCRRNYKGGYKGVLFSSLFLPLLLSVTFLQAIEYKSYLTSDSRGVKMRAKEATKMKIYKDYRGEFCKKCGEIITVFSTSGYCRRCWHEKRGGKTYPGSKSKEVKNG